MNYTYKRVQLLKQAFLDSLTSEATNRLLRAGGEPELYVKNKRDAICIFCLNQKMDLRQCNTYLERYGEVPLV